MANTLENELYNMINVNSNSSKIKQLIDQGADCNLSHFDYSTDTFTSPIQLAAKNKWHNTLFYLYEHRNRPTKTQLEKHLGFYINHYDPSQEEENETLLEYIVSRLLHTHITSYPKEEFHTVIAAVHDYDKAELRGQSLSAGSTYEIFLQLRIFTLFRKTIEMIINSNNDMLAIVENELLHNLETYYFLDGISHIPVEITTEMMNQEYTVIELSQPLLIEYYQYIAKNLISKIEKLEPNHEYIIPTGWMAHAVCVSFRRIDDTHKISIRIDNPSSGNPPGAHRIYPTADRYNLIEPRILGQLNMNDLENNSNYFISLIHSVKQDLTPKKGISLIYNLKGQIQNLKKKRITNVPSIAEQAAANCFVKCFEPGFRIRLGPTHQKLCEQLLSFEKDNANLLARRCKENHRRDPIEFSICFALLAMEDDPIILPIALKIRLQQKLKASYQHYYRQLSSIFTRGGCKLLTEKYVPLQFEKDHIPIDLESLFVKNRVLVLGEAGSGKTTVCQYITYSWTRTKIGESKFEWLFYIKMRNLNSKRYPLQSNNYSLIDIIEKECFQGYELVPLEKLKLKFQLTDSSNILWILDGLDERIVPEHLHLIEEQLLAKPHLLLTSRPYVIYDFHHDVQVQIQGFTYQDIENYINKYFSIMFRMTAIECWSFICSSEQLLQTARIPACLEIICSLWDNDKKKLDLDMTMGQLYQKMCEYLLRRYLLKFHRQCTSALAGTDVYQLPNAMPMIYLERLAFEATKLHEFEVDGDKIAKITGPKFLPVLQIGLLIPQTQNPSPILVENIYYFVHRSFQEYLCARYMIKALSLSIGTKQQREVVQFITYEKYSRHLCVTFRLFFELKRSSLCTDQFWSAVDSEPRDLVGLRHCSRIMYWFPIGSCAFPREQDQINRRTTDAIQTWISNKNRLAHDYGNTYLFDWFFGVIDDEYWSIAWKEDLFMEDSSKRRYFLPDLWSTKNIVALREIYNIISEKVKELHRLIKEGPTTGNLKRLGIDFKSFTLYTVDDKTKIPEVVKTAQKKAKGREPITTLVEFKELLQSYASFADLNRRDVADGKEIWRLKIDPSVLKNINNEMLERLLRLLQDHVLFFRDVELSVMSFLKLYAERRDLNDDILSSLIVFITMSNDCLLTAPPGTNKLIRVHKKILHNKKTSDNIELDEQRWRTLISAFDIARDNYGYSSFFV